MGSFRFMELPPELRHRIYEFTLSRKSPIHRHSLPKASEKNKQQAADPANTNTAALLQVSKLVYREALPVLYDVNVISLKREESV
jgi:hypothetical protein